MAKHVREEDYRDAHRLHMKEQRQKKKEEAKRKDDFIVELEKTISELKAKNLQQQEQEKELWLELEEKMRRMRSVIELESEQAEMKKIMNSLIDTNSYIQKENQDLWKKIRICERELVRKEEEITKIEDARQ